MVEGAKVEKILGLINLYITSRCEVSFKGRIDKSMTPGSEKGAEQGGIMGGQHQGGS